MAIIKKTCVFPVISLLWITIYAGNAMSADKAGSTSPLENPLGATRQAIDNSGGTASVTNVAFDPKNTSYQIMPAGSLPATKNQLALGGKIISQQSGISLTYGGNVVLNHPEGQELFPGNSALASAFNSAFLAVKQLTKTNKVRDEKNNRTVTGKVNLFIPVFRKVQFMVLNDLYLYLTGVYELFNLTHFASQKGQDCDTKTGREEVAVYLLAEQKQAVNKKALIVSHLLNVIQSQMFFICSYNMPLLPKSLAIKTSGMLLEHDYSSTTIDINFLLRDFRKEYIKMLKPESRTPELLEAYNDSIKLQQTYVNTLAQILSFFSTYADTLKTNPDNFVKITTGIEQRIEGDQFQKEAQKIAASSQSREKKIESLRELKKRFKPINPPLFYYNKETLRALKIIPHLAEDIERRSAKNKKSDTRVGWPEQLTAKAGKSCKVYTCPDTECGNPVEQAYPVAFFTDEQNEVIQLKAVAKKLFINIPMPNGLPYVQEIIKQPEWLDGKDGILEILGACLGDYLSLIGKGILNPCTEQLLLKTQSQGPRNVSGPCQKAIERVGEIQSNYVNALVGEVKKTETVQVQPGATT